MNKSSKCLFLGLTLLILLISVGAISATEDNTSTTQTLSTTDTPDDVVTTSNPKIEDKKIETKKINSKEETKTIKQTTKKENTNKTVKKQTTHIITNKTVTQYFNKENNYTLSDKVAEGDTLDIQGEISGIESNVFQMIINKPVNIISSTNDALINLNTSCKDLVGTDPGAKFAVVTGADYTNVTGIKLYNTQFWVSAVNHVTFDNISAVVNGNAIGGGIGQTSIREGAEYITVKNSYFYTKSNGGSSTFVLAYANYCNIENCTIIAGEGAGNVLYFTTFNVAIPSGNLFNSFNNVTNCTICAESEGGICLSAVMTGHNNTIRNNYISGGLTTQMGASDGKNCNNFTIINNTLKNMNSIPNSVIINNTMNTLFIHNSTAIGNTVKGKTIIVSTATLMNNNLTTITINAAGKNSKIINNNISGVIQITRGNVTIENNTIKSLDDLALNIFSNNNIIRNNYIVSGPKAGADAIYIKNMEKNIYENNIPETGEEYNITDETYNTYFDENGVIKTIIPDLSKINLIGTFNNKNFTINSKQQIIGVNATLNNATIIVEGDEAVILLSNLTINTTNPNALILNSEGNNIKNVTIIHNTPTTTIKINGNRTKINETNIIKTINTNTNKEIAIIDIQSNNNTIISNNITVKSDIENLTVNGIIIENNPTILNNLISENDFNITAFKSNGIIVNPQLDNLEIQSNIITLNTTKEANAIIIKADQTTIEIQSNTINITSKTNATGLIMTNIKNSYITIGGNNINIISTNAVGMNLDLKDNTNEEKITYNNININVKEKVQGFIINFDKNDPGITQMSNIFNITSETYYDENAAILSINTTNLTLSFNVNATNASPLKIINGKSILLPSLKSVSTHPMYLINSTNITMNGMSLNVTSNSTINLINSSNNNISGNYLNANNVTGGDLSVIQDSNSQNNIIQNNRPDIYLLNNQTYKQIFDQQGKLNITNYNQFRTEIYLTSDLNGVNIELPGNILFSNNKNYTLYNSTFILNGTFTNCNFDNLNIQNINRTAIIQNTTITGPATNQGNGAVLNKIFNYNNAFLNITGDQPAVIIYPPDDVNITHTTNIQNSTIIINGNNPTFIKSIGKGTTYYLKHKYNLIRSNISINGESNTNFANLECTYFYIQYSNLTIKSKNITTYTANNSYGSITNSNITLIGNNVKIADNMQSQSFIHSNIINITAKNPVELITVNPNENSTKSSTIMNNIFNVIVETPYNGKIPLINLTNASITNNIINVTDLQHNSILGNEAVIGTTVTNNTPNSPYHVLINSTATNLKFNKDGNITLKIQDLYANSLTGQITATIDGKTYKANGSEITIKVHPKTNLATVNVDFIPENETYMNITGHKELFNVSRGDAQIQVTVNSEIYAGQSITLTAVISDNGELIKDGYVAFKLNGVTLKDANGNRIKVRIINGVATLIYTIPSNYAAKDYLLTAVFSNGNYARVEVNQTVTIIPSNVFIQPTSVYYENGKLMIKADIKDAITNKDVAVRTKVTLKINGKTFVDRMVIENGTITIAQDIKLSNGIKTLTIISGPNKKYNVNEIKVNFMVTNTPVKQSKNATQITANDNLKAKV